MIEIPESRTLARQITNILAGRTITAVFNATRVHKFAWFSGDPQNYAELLVGKKIVSAEGLGAFVDVHLEDDIHITVGDGANLRYCGSGSKIPDNYQLLITFDDESFLVFTVAMYGAILAYRGVLENSYHAGAAAKPSPLDDRFDKEYFDGLFAAAGKSLSVKAFLATEQRIPGLGNGVLQDILFKVRIHPKRKLATLQEGEVKFLYATIKALLAEMTASGGRDTERDLYGNPGNYRTQLSKNTYGSPCPVCGGNIVKEAYLGGAVYYCPCCQSLK